MPRTSVIMPVRNGERFVGFAIDSVLSQLAEYDEIVVVDDKSIDDTVAAVEAAGDRRVQLLAGLGRGVSSARNIGLAAAQGEFIAFIDHDDLWPPGRHATLLRVLLADHSLDCAIGRIRLLNETDAVLPAEIRALDGRLAENVSLCAALFRRQIIDRVGGFDETMHHCEDTDYFLRMVEHKYRFKLCNIDALIYRRHGGNTTSDTAAMQAGLLELVRRRRLRNAQH